MARAPTTLDAFSAIAEPRRREVIDLLARRGPLPVGDFVTALAIPQPSVSKHLNVLLQVGIVAVQRQGRSRVYALNGRALKPVHAWTASLEHHWTTHLDRIKQRAERAAANQSTARKEP